MRNMTLTALVCLLLPVPFGACIGDSLPPADQFLGRQTNDSGDDDNANFADWLDLTLGCWPRISPPISPESRTTKVTPDHALDPVSRQPVFVQRVNSETGLPWGVFALQVQARETAEAQPFVLGSTADSVTKIERGHIQIKAIWQDPGQYEIGGSASYRAEVIGHRPAVATLAFSLKTILPEPLTSWNLEGELTSDSEGSEHAHLLLATSHGAPGGSRIFTAFGFARRQVKQRLKERRTSEVLDWCFQWTFDKGLRVGIEARYYLDVQAFDAVLILEVRTPWPTP